MSRRVHILEGTAADGTKLFTCGRKAKGAARCIGRGLVVDDATRREVTCALCLERLPFRQEATRYGWAPATADRVDEVAEALAPWTMTGNCEHGDHPAPEDARFCSEACERCEHESANDETGCDNICGRASARSSCSVPGPPPIVEAIMKCTECGGTENPALWGHQHECSYWDSVRPPEARRALTIELLELRKRTAVLTEALTPFAKRVVDMGMPRAKVDKDDLWVTIGFAQSVWLNSAKALVK